MQLATGWKLDLWESAGQARAEQLLRNHPTVLLPLLQLTQLHLVLNKKVHP